MNREFSELFLRGYGGGWVALVILLVAVLVSLLEGVNIGLLIPLLDVIQSENLTTGHWISRSVWSLFGGLGIAVTPAAVLLALFLVFAVKEGLQYVRMSLVARTTAGFVSWIRTEAFESLLRADLSYFHRQRLGVMLDVLTMQARKAGDAFYFVTEMLAILGVVAGYFVAAVLLSPLLTAIAVTLLIGVSVAVRYNIVLSRTWADRLVQRSNTLQATAAEYLSGIRVIKSFAIERQRRERLEEQALAVAEASYRLELNHAQMTVAQETVVFGLGGILVFIGIVMLKLTSSVLLAFLFVLFRLAPKVTYFNSRRHALVVCMASLRSVKALIDEARSSGSLSGRVPFYGLRSNISFENVCFTYDGEESILKDVTLTIEKGKTMAIVGASGAGKSTLVDLLLRFYDPNEGRITVDGTGVRELDMASWRRAIGVVSQDVFLFNDTILENIVCGRPDVSRAEALEAARSAHVHEFVSALPEGYETVVGDRGMRLSGGERQRLALARALVQKPEILILDEATSALDSESEQLIRDSLKCMQGSFTMVMIAHRLSSIEDADQIVVMEGGRIVEQGDRASLLAKGGTFARYYRLQVRESSLKQTAESSR